MCAHVCVCMSDGGLLEGLHCMNLPLCCGMEPKASLGSKNTNRHQERGLSKWHREEQTISHLRF